MTLASARLSAAAAASLAATAAGQATFSGLGTLPGATNSDYPTISSDGQWVVGASWGPWYGDGFRWSAYTGMQPISTIIGTRTTDVLISPDGLAIAGTYANWEALPTAFRWRAFDGLRDLGRPPGQAFSFGNGVSNNGEVVIGEGDTDAVQFRWSQPTGLQVIQPSTSLIRLTGVSADGRTIVGVEDVGTPPIVRAVRWTVNGGLEPLPVNSSFSGAEAVSADGTHIAGFQVGIPCRWVGVGPPEPLPLPRGWSAAVPTAISDDGTTIVGVSPTSIALGGFIWRESLGTQELQYYPSHLGADTSDWSDIRPADVNVDGRAIVGTGTYEGHRQVWIARFAAPPCYANCDGSSSTPVLNSDDFLCFLSAYNSGAPYANCDGSTTPPALNVSDFLCYVNQFATGCR